MGSLVDEENVLDDESAKFQEHLRVVWMTYIDNSGTKRLAGSCTDGIEHMRTEEALIAPSLGRPDLRSEDHDAASDEDRSLSEIDGQRNPEEILHNDLALIVVI